MQGEEEDLFESPPVWAVFGDLMAGLVGIFALFLVLALGFQVDLAESLQGERQRREADSERLKALEYALAGPLAEGRITFTDGKIGISGNILFGLNSAELQPEGVELIRELAEPVRRYVENRDELIMVSGFTDDLNIHDDNLHFKDNWELSSKRALTVVRELLKHGLTQEQVFGASFGESQPVVPNDSESNRIRNRRVEIAPVPKGASRKS